MADLLLDFTKVFVQHGLSPVFMESIREAACVALAKHHASPVDFILADGGNEQEAEVLFSKPDAEALRTWANADDCTEQAGTCFAFVALWQSRAMLPVYRMQARSGGDWYIAPSAGDDLEDATALEISATDAGTQTDLEARLEEKKRQFATSGTLRKLAFVVGFKVRLAFVEGVR